MKSHEIIETRKIKMESVDEAVKQLKRDLEGWREVIVKAESLLTWQRPTDPAVILATTTLISLLFWYLDPSFLTTLSLLGLVAVLSDYLVPKMSVRFSTEWTAKNEKKFDEVCKFLTCGRMCLHNRLKQLWNLRLSHPTKFFSVIFPTLGLLTWIGSSVNNILLTHVTVTLLLMLPGLNKKGMLAPLKKLIPTPDSSSKDATKTD